MLALSVGLVEPKQAAGIAGLVGLAAGAGLSGLLLLYVAIQMATLRGSFYGMDRFLVLNSIGFIVQGGETGLWLWKWWLDSPTAGRPAVGVGDRLLGIDADEPDRLCT